MSLVNQMLRDLDKRRAINEAQRVASEVRPLPPVSRSSMRPYWLVAGVVILVCAVAGVTWFIASKPTASIEAAAPALVIATKLEEPTKVVPPVAPEPAPAVDAPAAPENAPATKAADHAILPADTPNPVLVLSPKLDAKMAVATPDSVTEKTKSENKSVPKEPKAIKAELSRLSVEKNKDNTRSASEPKESKAVVEMGAAGNTTPRKSDRAASAIHKTEPVTNNRERAENEYRKALTAINQGRNNEALENLQAALRQDEMHYAARQLLVNMLLELRRNEDAMQTLRAGLHSQPGQAGWAMSLARLHVDQGQLDLAWATLEQSMPAASRNPAYQGFSGHVLQRLKRYKEAIKHFSIATQLAPNDGRWWLGLGIAFESEGMVNEAHDAFLHARQGGNLSAELQALVEQKLR